MGLFHFADIELIQIQQLSGLGWYDENARPAGGIW